MYVTSSKTLRFLVAFAAMALASIGFAREALLQQQMIALSKESMNHGLVRRATSSESNCVDPYHLGSSQARQATRPNLEDVELYADDSSSADPSAGTGTGTTNRTVAPYCYQTNVVTGGNCYSAAGADGCVTSASPNCTAAVLGCDITSQRECYSATLRPACQTTSSSVCFTHVSGCTVSNYGCNTVGVGGAACTAASYNCTSHSIFCHTSADGNTDNCYTAINNVGHCLTNVTDCTKKLACGIRTIAPACSPTSASGSGGCIFTSSETDLCKTSSGGYGNFCIPYTSVPIDSSQCQTTTSSYCIRSFADSGCADSWAMSCLNTQADQSICTKVGGCQATYGVNCYSSADQVAYCFTQYSSHGNQCIPAQTTEAGTDGSFALVFLFGITCMAAVAMVGSRVG